MYYSNVPDTTLNDNLIMIEDLPGVDLQVTGDHVQAGGICFIGFLFPFLTPPESSSVRAIMPLDDAELCSTEGGDGSLSEEGDTEPTASKDDSAETEVDTSDEEDTDGLGFIDEQERFLKLDHFFSCWFCRLWLFDLLFLRHDLWLDLWRSHFRFFFFWSFDDWWKFDFFLLDDWLLHDR